MSRDTGHRDKSPGKAAARGVSCCRRQSDGVTWDVCSIPAARGSFHLRGRQCAAPGQGCSSSVAQEPFFLLQTELESAAALCSPPPIPFHRGALQIAGHPSTPPYLLILHVLLLTSSLFLTQGGAAESRTAWHSTMLCPTQPAASYQSAVPYQNEEQAAAPAPQALPAGQGLLALCSAWHISVVLSQPGELGCCPGSGTKWVTQLLFASLWSSAVRPLSCKTSVLRVLKYLPEAFYESEDKGFGSKEMLQDCPHG